MKPGTSPDRALFVTCVLVIAFAFLACLPALFVPIGFHAEGDALDYRVPLLKWMLRHGALPNWSWTFVDDYPLLGELLMLPFFALSAPLARFVPILGYLACAGFGAGIAAELLPERPERSKQAFFYFVFASLLGLHPLLLQADHVMVDNIGSAFVLGTLYLLLRDRLLPAALLLACALATRYTTWGAAPGALLALLWLKRKHADRWRQAALFTAVASLGALPFLARNALLNGNPFFPLLNGVFGLPHVDTFDGWGRGKGPLALLLFPYDLVFTNSFVRALFDTRGDPRGAHVYKLSLVFHVQLICALAVFVFRPRALADSAQKAAASVGCQAAMLFFVCLFFFWWLGCQHLRYFGGGLVLLCLPVFYVLFTRLPGAALIALTLLSLPSVAFVRQESWRIALGLEESFIASAHVRSASRCFERAALRPESVVGFPDRDVINGYFDFDFVFVRPNNLAVEPRGAEPPKPDFIYSGMVLSGREGYLPWPASRPCLLKSR